MDKFQVGETVVCSHNTQKKTANVWADYSPATSIVISIFTPAGVEDITGTAMTNDSTGNYHYDYQSAGKSAGVYRARTADTDSTRITKKDGYFELEA